MSLTLAFDVYGTLINTHGVVVELEKMIGVKAEDFSYRWREKQLEYSFRRGLMQKYQDFSTCTKDALIYTNNFYESDLTIAQQNYLLDCYRTLPPFDDVISTLQKLKNSQHRLFAFSNGNKKTVEHLLESANIKQYFEEVVSVEDIRSFKPDPAVYNHFLNCAKAEKTDTWLISSNSFDVIGARSSGMKAAWVRRSAKQIFDPWGIEPTMIISGLTELESAI